MWAQSVVKCLCKPSWVSVWPCPVVLVLPWRCFSMQTHCYIIICVNFILYEKNIPNSIANICKLEELIRIYSDYFVHSWINGLKDLIWCHCPPLPESFQLCTTNQRRTWTEVNPDRCCSVLYRGARFHALSVVTFYRHVICGVWFVSQEPAVSSSSQI